MKKQIYFTFTILLTFSYLDVKSQVTVDGVAYNNFGYVSNYDVSTVVTAATGSIYTGRSAAIFDHNESGPISLQVNNPYNANGTGGSTDNFNGLNGVAGVQGVSGTVAPNFSTLVLKNGDAFNITNTQGANVFTTATFQNTITTTVRANLDAGALKFQNGATYTGGGTDNQHVDGYVGKIGNQGFVFPVGTGADLRTLLMTPPSSPTAQIFTAYNSSNVEDAAAVSAPIQSVYTLGSWDWIVPTGTDDDALTISVSTPDVTEYATTSDLRLVGWNGATSQWIDLSGSANATGTAEGSALSGTIPAGINITQIGIGSISVPLPVTLISFDAINEEIGVRLIWATANELNSQTFEIQHSKSAKTWEILGNVAATGNSLLPKSYNYLDQNSQSGVNYYRLKMIDIDQTYTYSRIVSVRTGVASQLIYPNPASEKINLQNVDISSIESIDIISIQGIVASSPAFINQNQVDVSHLAKGAYVLRLHKNNGITVSIKFIKI